MRGRFILDRTGGIDSAASLPAFFTTVPTNSYLSTFSEYHNFSPTLINEFRFGYNRNSNVTPAGNFSFPGLDSFPNLRVLRIGWRSIRTPIRTTYQFGYQNAYQLTTT